MKIGVMGCMGVVGQAVVKVFNKAHHIYGFDPELQNVGETGWAHWNCWEGEWSWMSAGPRGPMECAMVFICAPTPWDEGEECFDLTALVSCVKHLAKVNYRGLVVLKSTTLPTAVGELKKVMEDEWQKAWDAESPALVGCPEFLNARTAYEDMRDARHVVIGGAKYDRHLVLQAHKEACPGIQGFFLDSAEEAMVAKYAINAYFATKNVFFNQIRQFCQAGSYDWEAIRRAVVLDDRVHPVHTDSPGYDGKPGYGGMCLPKDVRALVSELVSVGVENPLIRLVDQLNVALRT